MQETCLVSSDHDEVDLSGRDAKFNHRITEEHAGADGDRGIDRTGEDRVLLHESVGGGVEF